jgi:hypothetical protein
LGPLSTPISAQWHLHRFRDTAATRWLRAGIDVRTVQAWLGHESLATTQKYLEPSKETEKALEKMRMPFEAVREARRIRYLLQTKAPKCQPAEAVLMQKAKGYGVSTGAVPDCQTQVSPITDRFCSVGYDPASTE